MVHGPNVAQGYWNDPSATAESFHDGWYRTGDLGSLDEAGRLYLKGRKKNLIVLPNGQNVFPEDVERVLVLQPGVDDAVVVGLSDSTGQEVHAVLLCAQPPEKLDTVIHAANASLAPHQRIAGFTLWPEPDFPRTHTLKVKRADVLARVQNQTSATRDPLPAPTQAPPTSLARLILQAVGEQGPPPSPDATLADIGLDSLARVELLAVIETELGVYLDEATVDATTTVANLEHLVAAGVSTERPNFPAWPRGRIARATRALVQPAAFNVLHRVAPLTVVGREHLHGVDGPVLFVANHTSHLDSAVLLSALPTQLRRRVAVAAAADYFFARPPLGSAVALLLNAFPFSRTSAVRPTLEHCARLLDQQWSILLYPEGTRSLTGTIGEFKAGVGLLAVELEVPVIPVHLQGLQQILPKGRIIPRRGPVAVTFGRPVTFPTGIPYDAVAQRLEDAVRSLPTGAPAALTSVAGP